MHQNGIIRKYILTVVETETNTNFTVISYNTSINIYSLHPFYNYKLTVAAYTIAVGPQSQIISVQTAQDGKSDLCVIFYYSAYSQFPVGQW